jgi:hypothetical protein
VQIFLNWTRFVVEDVVRGRPHVFINMDETQVSSIKHSGKGLVAINKVKRDNLLSQPKQPRDRTDVKTSLMGTVCDCPALQPFLPQVMLPKYTKRCVPPQRFLDAYAITGGPFEYWHGSVGWTDSRIMMKWATRVRSVVSSFNSDTWIILIMDCSHVHLNVKTIAHLRRLGILVLMLPAKLTWLCQLLDVYVYSELKSLIRSGQCALRLSSHDGSVPIGAWIDINAKAIREVIVDRDWQDSFAKLGAGDSVLDMNNQLRSYVAAEDVTPSLPTMDQFARMVNRPSHTVITARLHSMVVGGFLDLQQLPLNASPGPGAMVDLPYLPAASKRARPAPADDAPWEDVVRKYLRRRPSAVSDLDILRGPAKNWTLPVLAEP